MRVFTQKTLLLLAVFSLSQTANADVSPQSPYWQIPAESTISLKLSDDVNLPPNTDAALLIQNDPDTDSDGVGDHIDWCTQTPSGVKVWTYADYEAGRCRIFELGCSGSSEEKWLYKRGNSEMWPAGKPRRCVLYYALSGDDRVLSKSASLKVLASDDASIPADERGQLQHLWKEVLLLRSSDGTNFGVTCYENMKTVTWHSDRNGDPDYLESLFGAMYLPLDLPVSQVQPWADVQIAPTKPISK